MKCAPSDSPMTLVSGKVWLVEKFEKGHPKGTCQMRGVWFFWRFSTNMSSYLENGAFQRQSYYSTVIGNRRQAIERCHFRWPWMTPDPGFKDTLVLKAEYLENGAFYTQSYYRTVIGNHIQAIEWCHFQWPLVTPDRGFKVMAVLEGEYLENGAF